MTETTTRNGCNYSRTVTPSVGASPYTFTNTENVPISVSVSGGTVTGISMAPNILDLVNLGILGGTWHMNPGAAITITYILAPTVTYWAV